MKKFLKGLIITLVVLIVLPIALVFIFLFDTGKMAVDYDENFNKDNWSESLVVDSLDYAPTEKLLKFGVSENDINNFINDAIKNNAQLNKYLTQLALDIREDCYVLNVSGKYSFFETRAKMTMTITKDTIKDDKGQEQEAFVLNVNKMTLGRLTKLKPIITYVINKFIDDKTIDALTSSLKLHSDLANSRFYIFTSDLRGMINEAVNGNNQGGDKEFYFAFINDFLDMNLINIDFYGGDSFTINVNLEPLTGNDYGAGEYVYYPMPYADTTTKLKINNEDRQLSLNTIREALVYLLDNGVIDKNVLLNVSDFLFDGYQPGKAPSADLSSIGIMNKKTYKGFNVIDTTSIDDKIKNDISTYGSYDPAINSFDIVNLTESDINLFLKSQNIFGNKYLLGRDLPNDKHKINYIALDNAYLNIYGNNAIISVGLNLNGLETIVTLKMDLDTSNDNPRKLIYIPNKIYFGKESSNLDLSVDSKKLIIDTLHETVNSTAFSFDNQGKLTINFEPLINQAINTIDTTNPIMLAFKNFLQSDAYISSSIDGNTIEGNTAIKIQAVRR